MVFVTCYQNLFILSSWIHRYTSSNAQLINFKDGETAVSNCHIIFVIWGDLKITQIILQVQYSKSLQKDFLSHN